jgi:hypothetical protein
MGFHDDGGTETRFHAYLTKLTAAYGFLVSEKETIPPLGTCPGLARLELSEFPCARRVTVSPARADER